MIFKLPIVCAAILAALTIPGESGSLQAQTPAEAALVEVEGRWVAALVKGDTAALDSILVATYVDTDESGHRSNKKDLLHAFKSGDLKMTSITLADMRVYLYGNVAVVTGTANEAGAFQGHPVAPRIVFTDSFVLLAGQWHPVSSQRTVAPAD